MPAVRNGAAIFVPTSVRSAISKSDFRIKIRIGSGKYNEGPFRTELSVVHKSGRSYEVTVFREESALLWIGRIRQVPGKPDFYWTSMDDILYQHKKSNTTWVLSTTEKWYDDNYKLSQVEGVLAMSYLKREYIEKSSIIGVNDLIWIETDVVVKQ